MVFKAGNNLWEVRSKHGRHAYWDEPKKLLEACIEYFEWADSNPIKKEKLFQHNGKIIKGHEEIPRALSIYGLCGFLGINRTTWYDYKLKDDFSNIISVIENALES